MNFRNMIHILFACGTLLFGATTHSHAMEKSLEKGKISGAMYYIIHTDTKCTLSMGGGFLRQKIKATECRDYKAIDHNQKMRIAFYDRQDSVLECREFSSVNDKIDMQEVHAYASALLDEHDDNDSHVEIR